MTVFITFLYSLVTYVLCSSKQFLWWYGKARGKQSVQNIFCLVSMFLTSNYIQQGFGLNNLCIELHFVTMYLETFRKWSILSEWKMQCFPAFKYNGNENWKITLCL